MAASPAKFLFGFLFISIILWLLFIFASRLVAWVLSRVMRASVEFRVSGWKCLRDVNVKFKEGAIESVSVGEIRLSVRQSLVKLGVGFMSKDPKLQVLICDLEIVTRASKKKSSQKAKSQRSRTSGRGKWMVVANVARFLSVCITELLVKTPKATLEVKELVVDISKVGGSKPALFVKLHLVPIYVHLDESRVVSDQTAVAIGSYSPSQTLASTERSSSPFSCEEFSLLCEFGHDRYAGIVARNLDITVGEVSINLDDNLFWGKRDSANTFQPADELSKTSSESAAANITCRNQPSSVATKYASIFPEKISFTLPKLDVKFVHREHGIVIDNNIMGIEMRSVKSQINEDVGESMRLDMQMEFREIHILRQAGISIVEIMKLDVIASAYLPLQPATPIRSEIDIKLGGTQFNLIVTRFIPLLKLHSLEKNKVARPNGSLLKEKSRSTEHKNLLWTCTVSAPEMTFVLYSLNDQPLYHCCSQSSHVFANNISSTGASVHMELGELNLHMSDEYQECLRESLFCVETNTGPLMHIAKISLDLGKKDMELPDDGVKLKMVISVDVSGMGICLTFKRLESLISTSLSFKDELKKIPFSKKSSQEHAVKRSRTPKRVIQLLNVNLEKCSINMCGEVGLEKMDLPDIKRVNFGSQGGRTTISVSADGTPRTAYIMSTVADEYKKMEYCAYLDIFHLTFSMDMEKRSIQMDIRRARSVYQELLEDSSPGTKVTLIDMQNAKLVKRSGGLKEISVCSLFSATDIAVRWEPDVHIALVELGLHLKSLASKYKVEGLSNVVDLNTVKNDEQNEMVSGSGTIEKQKKRESIFAVDVEMLRISAEVGDGVESLIQVQSIFSENAQIGVLLEGILFDLNDARILKSSRMQISRVPNTANNVLTAKSEMSRTWDWVIQALDVHICMPYRLQLRAIDDSIEEMLRAVKLIVAAKTQSIFPIKKGSDKPKKSSSSRVGCLRFCIRKLAVEIEEEPLQGWLDEHYQLLKNEACELAVRFKFLDDLMPKSRADMNEFSNFVYNGEKIDPLNPLAIKALQDEIYKESFRSYYQACRNLKPSEGSGACKVGFQAGFKPSTNRTSILSLSATEFDVTLTRIEGGEAGMIEVVQQLDPVSRAHNIPFARLYGGNLKLNTGSLVVQLRNYTYPLFSGTSGKCEGRLVLAQQATCFQPQIHQDVYVGKWRKVRMLRSASGTTPPVKTYLDLPLHFVKGEICYGVGFEPLFTDISYSFTVALRRANLSTRNLNPDPLPPKKEKSLPWWDEMRNYIHGNTTLFFSETRWNILATTDPYEKSNKLQIISGPMEIQQSDGRVHTVAKDFRVFLSSLESLLKSSGLKPVAGFSIVFLEVPMLTVEVTMDWECDSRNPLNHYLFALPNEGKTSQKIYDPFRSTSLSLRWNLSLRPSVPSDDDQSRAYAFSTIMSENEAIASPTMNCGPQDLAWIIRFWNLNYNPPNKLRTFSRWPRFGVPRVARSGNLSLDKVMTEFMFRVDSTPACIRHMPLDDDDPAKGLTFKMNKLKYEMYLSRGKQKFTFECKRELLDFVYQGVDLHMPKAFIDRCHCPSVAKLVHLNKASHSTPVDGGKSSCGSGSERPRDDGFLLSSEYFTIRRQAPKADPERLLAWQEAGRRNIELTYVRSEFENGSESDEHARSDPSDDDGYNVVIADNCQRIFVYGLKLLWTLENRDAVWSWVGGLSKAFEPSKPSPSRQNVQRKLRKKEVSDNLPLDDDQKALFTSHTRKPSLPQVDDSSKLQSSPSKPAKVESSSSSRTAKLIKFDETEGEGTRHFMVNVIEPQFNLHSEEANGRFLLAAVSGRVLARSFPSVRQVGKEVPKSHPEMTWNCMEFSVMLEHVQAHVAPTDVDPGAGLQWLPKIRRSSPKVKRTGALLERVFMPCDMYFRYTRRKGGTSDPKVKPLKELTFNSHNITATMTSRQFQVMLDVLTNLLFARLPKPRRNSLAFSAEDDEDVGEEADEVVPDGVEEVESKRINLEQSDWGQKLILDDIRTLSLCTGSYINHNLENDSNLWMITGGRPLLIRKLKKELARAKVSRRTASSGLRKALQKAAQLRLSEKEKNKNPYAMHISLQINKVVWGMLVDGKSFAEAEISDMTYDFDTDYQDVGVARFTTKYFVVRNCLPSAKSDMLLSAWNPPPEWGKKVMLRVDAKQGAPKDGNSPLELFENQPLVKATCKPAGGPGCTCGNVLWITQPDFGRIRPSMWVYKVEIYPLKIHLTEVMYRMMWEYFFPEEEQDSQRRQEVWKVSTTAGLKRIKKGSSSHESLVLSSQSAKDYEVFTKSSTSGLTDSSQVPKLPNLKESMVSGSKPELRRTSSFDRTWEETVAESVANELVLQAHSSSSKSSSFACLELPDEPYESKSKESKPLKPGRTSHEEKKVGKTHYDKKSRPRRMREFHNIKISQVELLVTYEGSRFAVSDLRLLMDTFHRVEFVGTWRRLFSRVKKHIIWGVLKSVTGMQGKKFKDKAHNQSVIPDDDLNLSDSDGGAAEKSDHYPTSWPNRPGDGAGDGFVTSIRGLFNSQRRKAKAFVLRTMRGEAENELHDDWSESEAEFSPFARQLTITKAKRLFRRHTKKFRSRGHKGSSSQQRESLPSSPRETLDDSNSSSGSSPYEDFLSTNPTGME